MTNRPTWLQIGWPKWLPRNERRWRWFFVGPYTLGYLAWRVTPQPRYLLHRCEVCNRRFNPWGTPKLVGRRGSDPYVHWACDRGPGLLIPKRFVPAIERMLAEAKSA